jgi:hypothetical protein
VIGRGYCFDTMRGPVLEFQRCTIDNRVLHGGSLGGSIGYWAYVAGAKTWGWADKPANVVQWMDAIVRRVRRSSVMRYELHCVAPHAFEWKRSGKGDFATR